MSLWLVNGGTSAAVDAAAAFDKAHPGMKINITFLPNNNAGKQKLTIAMAGNQPPTMIVSSGGGTLKRYVRRQGGAAGDRAQRVPGLAVQVPGGLLR